MEKYVMNKKHMSETKEELENAMLKIRRRSNKNEIWKPEKFTISKHMIKEMAFLGAK